MISIIFYCLLFNLTPGLQKGGTCCFSFMSSFSFGHFVKNWSLFMSSPNKFFMSLFKIVLTYLFSKTVSLFSCLSSFSYYSKLFQSLLSFLHKLFNHANSFMIYNESFYLMPFDSSALLCLIFSFISLMNMSFIILFFYCSCPILLSYFTKVFYFFMCGVTVKFSFKFYEINTYLIVLMAYVLLLFILLFFYVLLFLYLIVFFYIFFYNMMSFLFMLFSLFY